MLRSRALCPAWSGAALGDICADHRTEARGSSAGARPGPVHGAREASSRRDTAGGARGRPEVAAVSAREMSADGTSGGAERAAGPEGRRGLAISVSRSMFSKAEAGRRRATLCAAWHFAFSPSSGARTKRSLPPSAFSAAAASDGLGPVSPESRQRGAWAWACACAVGNVVVYALRRTQFCLKSLPSLFHSRR